MNDRRQLAGYAGYVAIVAGALALVLYAVRASLDPVVLIAAALAVVAVVAWVVLDWERVRQSLSGRQVKYGSSSVLLTLSFIGIICLGNVVSNRFYRRIDTTVGGRYSLSPQTVQVLASVTDTVEVYSFFDPEDTRKANFENLLEEYRHRQPLLTYTVVDIDAQPALARQLEVTTAGVIVFVHGDRTQKVYGVEEQDITGGILRVLRDTEPIVYWVTGHQERDPQSYDSGGYSTIGAALTDEGYTVTPLNLAAGEALPTDAAVIVVASPRDALTADEATRLTGYVQGGGRVLLLNDPGLPDVGAEVLALFGLQWDNDLVIDPEQSLMGTVGAPLVSAYPYTEITSQMQGLTTFYPYSRSLKAGGETLPEGMTVSPVVMSGPNSWGETDLAASTPTNDPNTDLAGPLNLCMSGEDTNTGARIVACGDSDFASDQVFQNFSGTGNGDLFLNSVNWLAEDENLISIRTQPTEDRTVMLTPQQGRAVQVVTIVLMPLAVAAVGVSVWWRRRA
ncbi:MAG: GldG family protein [Anaerolineae bacterium]